MTSILYAALCTATLLQLWRAATRAELPIRLSWWGLSLFLTVAVPSLLQFAPPRMLALGERSPDGIRGGESDSPWC